MSVSRGRVFAISAVAVALAGGVAIVIAATRPGSVSASPGPDVAVRGFFDALVAGDARTALTYVDPLPGFDPATDPLLTDAALAPEHRPAAVRIGAVRPSSDSTIVEVTYEVRGTTVQQAVGVTGDSGGYRLRNALVGLTVSGAEGRAITVNGLDAGTEDFSTGAFPGAYEVAVEGSALFDGESFTVVPEVVMGGVAAAANFGVPEVSEKATAEIQRQVRRALDVCAKATSPKPPGCPFSLDVPGAHARVKWAITTYPTVTPKATEVLSGLAISLTGDGVVHWSADAVDKSGRPLHGSGDLRFSIAGSAKPAGSGIAVSLTT
jgi:hypothetical protein